MRVFSGFEPKPSVLRMPGVNLQNDSVQSRLIAPIEADNGPGMPLNGRRIAFSVAYEIIIAFAERERIEIIIYN